MTGNRRSKRQQKEAEYTKRRQKCNIRLFFPVSCCFLLFLAVFCVSFCHTNRLHAEPNPLTVFAVPDTTMSLPDDWIQVIPGKQKAYTNYIVKKTGSDYYLNIQSGGTGSWIEKDLGSIDVHSMPIMEWSWRVIRFPDLEWEAERSQDDFAIRIELVYDFRGSAFNILNIIRKGLITTVLKRNPPVLTISYVWAHKVPAGKPYVSPSDKRTIVIPIESGTSIRGVWIDERRNILEDLRRYYKEKNIVLKKIRIRSDTDDSLSNAESGLKIIELQPVQR